MNTTGWHRNNPALTNRQKQVINGTILGGSSIMSSNGKTFYLSMRDKNPFWIESKAKELQCLASETPFTIDKTYYRWHSLCFPVFKECREKFYKKKERCLRASVMDELQDIAFAMWYMDAGCYKNKKVILNTTIWGEKGQKIIQTYFKHLGYVSTMIKKRNGYKIMLDEASSISFSGIVNPHIPTWALK